MKPYEKKYVIEKIREYNEKISLGKIGDFEIKKIKWLEGIIKGYMYEKEGVIKEDILELHGPKNIWMRITPLEIESSYMPISRAVGKVGIVGLGLGYVVQEMAKKDSVKEIIVYEIDKDVIELYKNNFKENEKIKILNEDAFKAESQDFDFFYVDIYEYKLTKKVVKDYIHFNNLHRIEEYSFWGMEHFLLSCRYEEIVWVFIPENWMEMSREIFEALKEEGLLTYYKKLDTKLVSSVLSDFKVALE
ncbi:spermine/spermidine synthase domain-containing protein [Clostridium septicum]|uniref:Uncharacterized protein n=1 Tax=Clostridium septicum TaxID=1504 RepID=A0A9N7JLW3_CLOSE|nr:hypothetical protein [Clostridium septicum]AYE34943.1 hypothetical protein CP523_11255 [Clostridium septicum]MDU1313837.1 hypothetical protein [Clostridium septicum]QAS60337.1 hypothetical protein EI377_06065 [Clostridium septicum]UEC20408.1 hypothetical protein LK444_13570 [Clostridium septicum]USS01536.1 hypothetical protein NH397_03605 [Clostridium septicum]